MSCYLSSSFHFLFLLRCLSWNILCCDVYSRQRCVLKDIWESTRPILAAKGCVMRARHVSCVAISSRALYPPVTLFSLSALFCSSDSLPAVPIVISHVLSPLFPLCSAASHLHFLTYSSSQSSSSLPTVFSLRLLLLPFPPLICHYSLFSLLSASLFPPLLLCEISDPAVYLWRSSYGSVKHL